MGFGLGVHSEQVANNYDCYRFIERDLFEFVDQGTLYGEKSILIRSGKYYGLDLSPLLKVVYTTDEVSADYIKENIQEVDFLLNLITAFRDRIQQDRTVCDKIEYVWYEDLPRSDQDVIDQLIREKGEEHVKPLLDIFDMERNEIEANPNPWKWYFEQGRILQDLDTLLSVVQCYKDKGASTIFLTAG